MNDKLLCIGIKNLFMGDGKTLFPVGTLSDSTFSIGTETPEVIQNSERSFSFTILAPKLRLIRCCEVDTGSKRKPLKSKEIANFIKRNQL
ncbi:hypothetical protein DW083_17320 [Parabacteroides sp. AF48-14]|nr:hypothetical protein DW083_17320 [Parabacteroides sp. AF48-14]